MLPVCNDLSFDEHLSAHDVVLVELGARWCGPCKLVEPALEELVRQFSGEVSAVKVDTDESPAINDRFRPRALPTMILFRGGQPVARRVGAAPVGTLVGWVREALAQGRSAQVA